MTKSRRSKPKKGGRSRRRGTRRRHTRSSRRAARRRAEAAWHAAIQDRARLFLTAETDEAIQARARAFLAEAARRRAEAEARKGRAYKKIWDNETEEQTEQDPRILDEAASIEAMDDDELLSRLLLPAPTAPPPPANNEDALIAQLAALDALPPPLSTPPVMMQVAEAVPPDEFMDGAEFPLAPVNGGRRRKTRKRRARTRLRTRRRKTRPRRRTRTRRRTRRRKTRTRRRTRRQRGGGLRVGQRVKLSPNGIRHYMGLALRLLGETPDEHAIRADANGKDWELDALFDWSGIIQEGWSTMPSWEKLVEWNPKEKKWRDPVLRRLAELVFYPVDPAAARKRTDGREKTIIETQFLEGVKKPKSARKIPGSGLTLSRRSMRRRAITPAVRAAAANVVRATGLQAGGRR